MSYDFDILPRDSKPASGQGTATIKATINFTEDDGSISKYTETYKGVYVTLEDEGSSEELCKALNEGSELHEGEVAVDAELEDWEAATPDYERD